MPVYLLIACCNIQRMSVSNQSIEAQKSFVHFCFIIITFITTTTFKIRHAEFTSCKFIITFV